MTGPEADQWLGYVDGQVVATYADRSAADGALERREVQAVAPAVQPGVSGRRDV
jgi:hypothetical protein